MFSPTLGRWIQSDPIEYEAGDSNLYRFEGDNPANRLDPTGLCADTYPRPLTPEELREQKHFPHFPADGAGVTVIGPKDNNVNCLGHACGIKGRIDSHETPPGSNIKPPKSAFGMTDSYIDEVMKFYGYKKVSGECKPEKGKIKVATYGLPRKSINGPYVIIKHAAVSTDGNPWQSKLGNDILIQHSDLGILENRGMGEYFGDVVGCYEKDVPKQIAK